MKQEEMNHYSFRFHLEGVESHLTLRSTHLLAATLDLLRSYPGYQITHAERVIDVPQVANPGADSTTPN